MAHSIETKRVDYDGDEQVYKSEEARRIGSPVASELRSNPTNRASTLKADLSNEPWGQKE